MLQFFLLRESECTAQPINTERNSLGEYHRLYEDLRQRPTKFAEYTRIETFDYLLISISGKLQKKCHSFHGRPILQEERFILTLRYVNIKLIIFSFYLLNVL